jgi:hypothetical protein
MAINADAYAEIIDFCLAACLFCCQNTATYRRENNAGHQVDWHLAIRGVLVAR